MRIWLLHTRAGGGVQAWGLDQLGFATWSPTRDEVLERTPAKFDEHHTWLTAHGFDDPRPSPGVDVIEEVAGNEILFTADLAPATAEEVALTAALLDASRTDLLEELASLPDGALDWDPPYREFAAWARWRTIRQIVAHLANTETHYYLPALGLGPQFPPVSSRSDPESFLADRRATTLSALESLESTPVRAEDGWSVRKVLRRLVWHERLHTKSIRRIHGVYDGASTTSR
jgi:hypothetical protein